MSAYPDHPFTWADARRWGVPRHRLDQDVANRVVRRAFTGVYVRADQPDSPRLRAAAAALVISPWSVACDRTAAWLHGVDVLDHRELEVLPPVETFVLRGHRRTELAGCRGGSRDLRDEDVCVVGGIQVTTPLRTALDLGCALSRRRALAALDAFMRHHGITHTEMHRLAVRYFRRRGVVQLRQLIPLADPRAESPGESWARLEILDAGLPAPVLQHWVAEDGVPVFRLDLAYPRSRVAIEYDGREFHEGVVRRERDVARRQWLRERGWTVIVVGRDDFTAERVDDWVGELRSALRLAA